MTIREYIKAGNSTPADMADTLGVSEHAIRKWVYGQRRPDLEMMLKIEACTEGEVTVADWARATA